MSAYQVSKDTIDLMVSVLTEWGRAGDSRYLYTYGATPNDPELLENTEVRGGYNLTIVSGSLADALGRELIDANVSSLMSRYSDPRDMTGELMCDYFAESYTHARVFSDLVTVPRAMGAVKCYRYQACEHDAWRGSFADELSQRVMDKLVDLISDGWEWTRPADAPKVISITDLMGGK